MTPSGAGRVRAERYTTIVNEGVSLHVSEGKEIGVTLTYVGVERMSDRHQIEFGLHRWSAPAGS